MALSFGLTITNMWGKCIIQYNLVRVKSSKSSIFYDFTIFPMKIIIINQQRKKHHICRYIRIDIVYLLYLLLSPQQEKLKISNSSSVHYVILNLIGCLVNSIGAFFLLMIYNSSNFIQVQTWKLLLYSYWIIKISTECRF